MVFWLDVETNNNMKSHDMNSIKMEKGVERFKGKELFPKKVELAKKMLANVKLPEIPEKK